MDESATVQPTFYRGNCHCGGFRFTVKTTLDKIYGCNCSNCSRHGALWLIGLTKEDFVVEKGDGTLKEYLINPAKGNVVLLFCQICGTAVMERKRDGTPVLNLRAFENIDLEALNVIYFDMFKVTPLYVPPPIPEHHSDIRPDEGQKVYHGNCHCKKIIYTVKSKPFEELEVVSCNCSSCSRNGDLWIYPTKDSVMLHGEEHLVGYEFLHKDSLHSFCGTCGVSILVNVTEPGTDIMPINVRTMNDIDLGCLKIKKYDGASRDPQYRIV